MKKFNLVSIILACLLLIISGSTVLADDPSNDDFKVVVTAQLEGFSDDFNINGADIRIEYFASLSDTVYQIRQMPPGRFNCRYNTITASITITNRPSEALDIIGLLDETNLVVWNNYYTNAPNDYCSLYSVYTPVLDDTSGVENLSFNGIQIDFESPEFFLEEEPIIDLWFFWRLFWTDVASGNYIGQVEVNDAYLYDLNNVEILIQPLSSSTPTISTIISDVEEYGLPDGIKNSLISKLKNAQKALEKGNDGTTINMLNAFINAVEAQRGKKISDEATDSLIAQAEAIIGIISVLPDIGN